MKKQCVLFDLDGTLCDVEHRRRYVRTEPKNWDAFNKACVLDKPNPHVLLLFNMIDNYSANIQFIFFSGRSGKYRKETIEWLIEHLAIGTDEFILYMRDEKDKRPDDIVKKEFLDEVRETYEVLFAVDDRNSVVHMLRENGVSVFQAAPGDF